MTPIQLRDLLRTALENPSPNAKIYTPWVKGQKRVVGFHIDDQGNLVFEVEK